jgi:carbamoyl-phosphate synthase large subunit
VKIPRWDFEKFKGVDDTLGVQMKSVGEAMAIGRTFKESFQKALRSLEQGRFGLGTDGKDIYDVRTVPDTKREELKKKVLDRLKMPKPNNVFYIRYAFQLGVTIEELHRITKIDPWFLYNMKQIVDFEEELHAYTV